MSSAATLRRNRGIFLLVFAFALITLDRSTAQGTDATALRASAIAMEQRGENAEAEEAWQAIAKADPDNADALAHLGLLEARQDRLENAIGYYRRAMALKPDLPGLQMNLGLALFKAAQFPDAMKMFSAEIKKHPDDRRLTILLGMAHYGMKDYFVAIPYLRRAANHDPQNLTLRMALARSCLVSEQYQCVIDVHREIESRNPGTAKPGVAESGVVAEADLLAAEALDAREDVEGAVAQVQAAVRANPEEANVHFALGYLLWTKGQWGEAAREFQAELQRNPQNSQARIYLADTQVQQGDFVTPVPELKDLIASNPEEPLVHLDVGIIAAKNGRTEDAIRELRTAGEYAPEDALLKRQIAKELESLGQLEEAKLERERANRMPQSRYPSLLDVMESSQSSQP